MSCTARQNDAGRRQLLCVFVVAADDDTSPSGDARKLTVRCATQCNVFFCCVHLERPKSIRKRSIVLLLLLSSQTRRRISSTGALSSFFVGFPLTYSRIAYRLRVCVSTCVCVCVMCVCVCVCGRRRAFRSSSIRSRWRAARTTIRLPTTSRRSATWYALRVRRDRERKRQRRVGERERERD